MDLLWCVLVSLMVLGVCSGASEGEAESHSSRAGRQYRYQAPAQIRTYQNITRIIGGQVSTEPIPYQVSIQLLAFIKWKHFCGGSIIGKNHVLTAAHCVDKLRPERMSIVVGTNNYKSGGVRHSVLAYKKHPQYDNKGFLINDLAIIKVTPPFQLNKKTIDIISLAANTDSRIENNFPVTLTGWGATSPTNQAITPDSLMILHYNTISNAECQKKGYKVTPNEICTLIGKTKGACVGDSGGPLVNRERKILYGVVSYGSAICASGFPDVYTRVANFVPWIQQVVRKELP